MIILVFIILLILSSIGGGLMYWKRRNIFGKKEGKACKKDPDCQPNLTCENEVCTKPAEEPAKLGESCEEKSCESPLVCDESALCAHAPVPCRGSWGSWGSCSVTACGSKGIQTRTYTIQSDAAHGGDSCPHVDGYEDEQPCSTEDCTSIAEEDTNAPVEEEETVYYRYKGKDVPNHDITGSLNIIGTVSENIRHCNSLPECQSFNRHHQGNRNPGRRINSWFKRDTATELQDAIDFDFYSKTNLKFDVDSTPTVIRVGADGSMQEDGCWPEWNMAQQGYFCTTPTNTHKTFDKVENTLYAPGGWGGYGWSLDQCKQECVNFAKYGHGNGQSDMANATGCKGFYWLKNRQEGPICLMVSNDDISTNVVSDSNADLYIMKDA